MKKSTNRKQSNNSKYKIQKDKSLREDNEIQASNREILEGNKLNIEEEDNSNSNSLNEENEDPEEYSNDDSEEEEVKEKQIEKFDIKLFMIVNRIN